MRSACTIGLLVVAMVGPARAERIAPTDAVGLEQTTCEETWTWVSPLPQGNSLTDVAFSPTAGWVGVGLGGAIVVSADGRDWANAGSGLPPDVDLHAVTWGGGQFVAVGGRKSVAGPRVPVVVTSPDGRVWTRHDPTVTRSGQMSLKVVASSGWGYAAVDESGFAWTSPDGASWSTGTQSVGVARFTPGDLIWTGHDFVLVGRGMLNSTEYGGVVVTSADGASWQPHLQGRGELFRVASHGDTVVAVGSLDTVRRVGENAWEHAAPAPNDVEMRGAAWAGDRFVAVGYSNSGCGRQFVMESLDGGEWTEVPAEAGLPDNPTNLSEGSPGGSQILVAVGSRGQLAASPDGRAWERRSRTLGANFNDVAWTGSGWVAVGSAGQILTSPDGFAWRREASPTTRSLLAVAAGGGRTVAVGVDEAVASGDGEHWALHGGLEATLFGVVWDRRRFLAVGAHDGKGVVLASPDGETWTRLDDGSLPELRSLVVADGRYVAYEWWGGPLASVDGAHWTRAELGDCGDSIPVAGAWNGRTLLSGGITRSWCDFICCGCCPGLTLATSDVSTWTCVSSGPQLADVAWDGRRFVAVGECGAIVTSPTGESWTGERGFVDWSLTAVGASLTAVVVVGPDTILTRRTCPVPHPLRPRLTSGPH